MCGITGILHMDQDRKADYTVIKKMTDTISYRGPDGEGYYVYKNIALGHRRLSIIDLNTGDQPMFSDDKKIVLVFNGEIYNYIELRSELKKLGHSFRTDSDTEIIIKSYIQWGIDCQNKFNGMWAFALWDDNKQLLLLSRDRIGEKPLHYAVFNNTLVFGSEIKSILAYGMPKIPDFEFLEIYLTLGYIPAPFTFFKNICKLKAGYCLTICGNEFRERQYWDLPEINEDNMCNNKMEIYENFECLLKDSVKMRMRSDVPYGAFLSGGLDSSSIVALMSEISALPVNTFTMGFKERSYDERYFAGLVSDRFRTNHHQKLISPNTFIESLNSIVFHYDEPFGDSSAISTGLLSNFASSMIKVVLTGDGGDEVLSGYTNYQGEKFATQYKKLPGCIRNSMPNLVSLLGKPFNGAFRYKLNRVRDVCFSSNMDFESRYLSKSAFIDIATIKVMTHGLKTIPIEDFLNDFIKKCNYNDPFYKLMYINTKLSLPDDMLTKVDRMSMAYGIETRTPFLDYRLVEYLAKVDKHVKMDNYERKTILRKTICRRLPIELLKAPKRGFGVPTMEWFKDDSFSVLLENLGNKMPYLNADIISKIVHANKIGDQNLGDFIWKLIVLQKSIELGSE